MGNPGEEYAKTRHNAGFWAVDAVTEHLGSPASKKAFGGLISESRVGEASVLLFKPQQFMNRSGLPVRQLLDYYDLDETSLCVAVDDVYLAPGSARFRKEGGNGGHNGMKSLLEHLQSDAFWRVRIGVGVYEQHPVKRQEQPSLEDYVLKPMPVADRKKTAELIDTLVPNLVQWLEHGSLTEETVHVHK